MNQHDLGSMLKQVYGQIKDAGEWIRIPCPTCAPKDAKKMKRYVSKRDLYTKCFICDVRLSKEELLGTEQIPIMDRPEREGLVVERKPHPWANRIPCHRVIPIHELPLAHPAVKFFHKDHLYDLRRYYEDHGIIYCPPDAGVIFRSANPFITSADRLIFPVRFNDALVGWQMRSIPGTVFGDRPDAVKYYHLFNKGDYLYNYDKAKQYKMVILTEGVKKALKFPNGVASWGKGLTSLQIQLLHNWNEIVIFLDGEDKTQDQAESIAMALRHGGKKSISIDPRNYGLPSPDEATVEQAEHMVLTEWNKRYGTMPS